MLLTSAGAGVHTTTMVFILLTARLSVAMFILLTMVFILLTTAMVVFILLTTVVVFILLW